MDIVSSLATLSFDKRRSAFFTNELIVLLKLIDSGIIDQNILDNLPDKFIFFQFKLPI